MKDKRQEATFQGRSPRYIQVGHPEGNNTGGTGYDYSLVLFTFRFSFPERNTPKSNYYIWVK
jgi:hypothetical protein